MFQKLVLPAQMDVWKVAPEYEMSNTKIFFLFYG